MEEHGHWGVNSRETSAYQGTTFFCYETSRAASTKRGLDLHSSLMITHVKQEHVQGQYSLVGTCTSFDLSPLDYGMSRPRLYLVEMNEFLLLIPYSRVASSITGLVGAR